MQILEQIGTIYEAEGSVRLAYAQALHAAGEHEAAVGAINKARARLLARADAILDAEDRRVFINDVSDHAQTLALSQAWAAP